MTPLSASSTVSAGRLTGEQQPKPRGPVATTLLAITGLLALRAIVLFTARLALAYRRPAELDLTDRGIEIHHRVELLGRVLRDRRTVIPIDNLASIVREVRYARLGLYAGLLALVLGTYFGVSLVADGLRVPDTSASLLGFGLLVIALGIVLDFVLSSVLDPVRRTVRLVITPKAGKVLCIAGISASDADRVLESVFEQCGYVRT